MAPVARHLAILPLALATALTLACGGGSHCYSPGSPAESLLGASSKSGCACNPAVDQPVCVRGRNADSFALICTEGHWSAVADGPCLPLP